MTTESMAKACDTTFKYKMYLIFPHSVFLMATTYLLLSEPLEMEI